jgi:predicted DNA-binding protein
MSDQGKSSRSGLKRPDAPVDLFTLQPEPDLIPDSQVEEDEKPKKQPTKPRTKRSTPSKRSVPKLEIREEVTSREERNEHVSVYLPGNLITRLDLLKRMERDRLRDENKKVSRSTLIQEAVEQYLEGMEK